MSTTRVLWVTKGLGRGGAERLLSLAAPHVDGERFEVEVAYELPWKDAFADDIRARGVPVHCVGGGTLSSLRALGRLRRLVRDRGFDLIHTHSPLLAALLRVGLGRATPPIVHTEHNVWERYRWPTYALNALTYGRNAHVVAVSDGVAASVARPRWAPWLSLPPVETVHHGIDETMVHAGPVARAAARTKLGLDPHVPVLGTVANFTPKKDQRTLLAAVQPLLASYPGLRLVLVGTGPLEHDLRAQAARVGMAEQVLFTGMRDDVQEILPAFDVFVLSSLHEGLSIAVLEAMAARVPCVVTRVGGLPELIEDNVNGVLVPPSDARALRAALDSVLADPARREQLGAAGAATAARFTIAAAVRRLESIYDEVVQARQGVRT